MAKIKLNGELPKGFKLVDGKIVEDKLMRHLTKHDILGAVPDAV